MKATAAISIAALLAALAATPTMALDLNTSLGASGGADVSSDDDSASVAGGGSLEGGVAVGSNNGDLGVDTTVTGAIGASASDDSLDLNTRLDLLLKLINESDYNESSFSAWANASTTAVVNTDDIFDADGQAKIDAALQANLDEQDDLNAAINANANLKAYLDSSGIDAASVIAIDVSADGSVHVYEG